MTEYSDVEAGEQARMEVLVEKKSSTGWLWKVMGALLVVALCVAGARLFAWCWLERPQALPAQPEAQIIPESEGKPGTHSSLQGIIKKAKAAIHLTGHYEERGSQLQWQDDEGQAFVQGGLRLRHNQVLVPHTGLYFVYSQASFRVAGADEATRRPLSHRIWHFSDKIGDRVTLMSAVRSGCQSAAEADAESGRGCYSAIYLGAVFSLSQGDALWTETSPLAALETEEGKTFFGVFAL